MSKNLGAVAVQISLHPRRDPWTICFNCWTQALCRTIWRFRRLVGRRMSPSSNLMRF